jgi:hypothetical protein
MRWITEVDQLTASLKEDGEGSGVSSGAAPKNGVENEVSSR